MPPTAKADRNGHCVRSVERALRILECFDDRHPEMGVSEIANAVGLHKATTHRIAATLVHYGYLEQSPDDQKYRLGLQLPHLGFQVVQRMNLRREALPQMKLVAQRLDETCDLCVFDRGEVFYVEVVRGKHALTIAASVGQRLPAHCTASGKLFLASLPVLELEGFLSRPLASFTQKTMTSREALLRELAITRRRGYGMDDEEMEAGVRAVSALIRNREGIGVAALSVPGPTGRLTMERVPEIAATLCKAADAVSRELGWRA
jgi:DNA-binding IclR family transcriptional regulator